jgi:hypothetical protein
MSGNVVDLAQFRARRTAAQSPVAAAQDHAFLAAQPMVWMPVFFFVPVFFAYTSVGASRAG